MSNPPLPPEQNSEGSAEADAGRRAGRDEAPRSLRSGLGGRARQRAETRERIFELALREFREVGFAAAQIDRIARAARVARGTFYFHFPSKDDVLLELARRINARIARRVAALAESGPRLRELLTRVNDAIVDEHSRVGESGLLGDMLALYVRRPDDLSDPSRELPTLGDELTRQLRVAEARGEIRSSMTVEQIATVFMTSLFGIYTRVPPGEELRIACAGLIELLVQGLQPDGP